MSYENAEFKKGYQSAGGLSVAWSEEEEKESEGSKVPKKYFGDVITGEFMKMEGEVGVNDSNTYKIKLEDGTIVTVWGTTVLDGRFAEAYEGEMIPEGAIVRITCLGKKQGKSGPSKQEGKGYWNFDLEYAIPSPTFKKAVKDGKASMGSTMASQGQSASKSVEDSGY